MIAHFANNAIIIALASAGMDEADATMSVQQRLILIAIGSVGLLAGAGLLARSARRTRQGAGPPNDAADQRL